MMAFGWLKRWYTSETFKFCIRNEQQPVTPQKSFRTLEPYVNHSMGQIKYVRSENTIEKPSNFSNFLISSGRCQENYLRVETECQAAEVLTQDRTFSLNKTNSKLAQFNINIQITIILENQWTWMPSVVITRRYKKIKRTVLINQNTV